ncbi:dihydrofolate reductase [Candidatus Nomurabacteria bacterium]|nr:dihydrofolate reductase [Candidatus Nomurabacteria bacterium]
MILSLIAGIGKNNELGLGNKLLWDLSRDMKHFRETTSGHPVIMGRKTFESIGKPLPNRRNVVITRDVSYVKEGVEVVHSLPEAIDLFKYDVNPLPNGEEVFVIGGAEIYKQAMDHADRLYITHVDGIFDADAFFPTISPNFWKEVSREHYEKDEENNLPMDFVVYEKNSL